MDLRGPDHSRVDRGGGKGGNRGKGGWDSASLQKFLLAPMNTCITRGHCQSVETVLLVYTGPRLSGLVDAWLN